MPAQPVVLIAQPHLARLLAVLDADYKVLPLWEDSGQAELAEAEALVVAGEFPVAPSLIDAMPKLGLIACFTVGYDGVDVPAMRARHCGRPCA